MANIVSTNILTHPPYTVDEYVPPPPAPDLVVMVGEGLNLG